MAKFDTSFIDPPRHTQPGLGREEKFTRMKMEAKRGGIKQARPEPFWLVGRLKVSRRF